MGALHAGEEAGGRARGPAEKAAVPHVPAAMIDPGTPAHRLPGDAIPSECAEAVGSRNHPRKRGGYGTCRRALRRGSGPLCSVAPLNFNPTASTEIAESPMPVARQADHHHSAENFVKPNCFPLNPLRRGPPAGQLACPNQLRLFTTASKQERGSFPHGSHRRLGDSRTRRDAGGTLGRT